MNYVEAGDVGAEYNTLLTNSEAAYQEFLTRLHTNMDALDGAIGVVFPQTNSIETSSGNVVDFSGLSYAQRFAELETVGIVPAEVSESISAGTFTVNYTLANSLSVDLYSMTIKINGLTADSSNSFGGLDGNGDSVDYFDPETWKVAGGLQQIVIKKGDTSVFEVNVTSTAMEIEAEAGFASDYANGDVGAILMEGDFSQTNAHSFFDIIDQLSLDPSSSSSSPSTDPFGSSESHGSSSSSSSSSSYSSSSSSSSSTPNYTIETVKIYGADSSQSNGLTADPVSTATIGTGSLSLQVGDYTMSLISQDLPEYITGGDIFNFANVDLLDVEEVIKDGVDGLFTLSHATHGELVIIESDLSAAPSGGTVTIGDGDTFGTYEGNRFVSDSNDIVAAYFDFGDLVVSDAQFQAYWDSIDGITDMFAEIA